MLQEAGIRIACLHGGLDGSEFDLKAMRLVLLAEKT